MEYYVFDRECPTIGMTIEANSEAEAIYVFKSKRPDIYAVGCMTRAEYDDYLRKKEEAKNNVLGLWDLTFEKCGNDPITLAAYSIVNALQHGHKFGEEGIINYNAFVLYDENNEKCPAPKYAKAGDPDYREYIGFWSKYFNRAILGEDVVYDKTSTTTEGGMGCLIQFKYVKGLFSKKVEFTIFKSKHFEKLVKTIEEMLQKEDKRIAVTLLVTDKYGANKFNFEYPFSQVYSVKEEPDSFKHDYRIRNISFKIV